MIKHTSIRYPLASLVVVTLAMQSACSDDGDSGSGSEGGADQGGTTATGGASRGGGNSPTGGRAGVAGSTTATGGSNAAGGSSATGGAIATGGLLQTAGTTAIETGGAPNGGVPTTGGATVVATGGTSSVSGAAGQVSVSGGTTSTGGTPQSTGGAPGAGQAGMAGRPNAAGSPSTAGAAGSAGEGGSAGAAGNAGAAGTDYGSCVDSVTNQDETDLDCGGKRCPPCAPQRTCLVNADCVTGLCSTTCTAPQSCRSILLANALSADGTYWIDPDLSGPLAALQVFCDMTTDGGGWTLVYRATNRTGTIENGAVTGPGAIGDTPFNATSEGQHKLADDAINALRSAAVANDLRAIVRRPGFTTLFGTAFHPKDCVLRTVPLGSESPAAGDICNKSTKVGPSDTAGYIQSGHYGSLTRWYVDPALGYIWPSQHIGPIPNGTDHGGGLPSTYCTWVDSRTCPEDSAFEIWAY